MLRKVIGGGASGGIGSITASAVTVAEEVVGAELLRDW